MDKKRVDKISLSTLKNGHGCGGGDCPNNEPQVRFVRMRSPMMMINPTSQFSAIFARHAEVAGQLDCPPYNIHKPQGPNKDFQIWCNSRMSPQGAPVASVHTWRWNHGCSDTFWNSKYVQCGPSMTLLSFWVNPHLFRPIKVSWKNECHFCDQCSHGFNLKCFYQIPLTWWKI